MNWNQEILKILGLTNTEITILSVITTAKNIKLISLESEISRTGVNYSIKNLIKKGLVFPIRNKKRITYQAISNENLVNKLDNIVNALNNKKKGVKITSLNNEFIIHIGADEIIPAYIRIASTNKNQRVRAIQHHKSYKELLEKITLKQLLKFNKSIIDNNIIVDGMLNQSAYAAYSNEIKINPLKYEKAANSLIGRMADYTSFPDNFFNYNSEIWIFKNTTIIINWHEEVAIEITNQNMTGFLKDMFEFVKSSGKKIDHNLEMKKVFKINGK